MSLKSPAIELREAQSAEELHSIYRFRYEIYVEEMQRKQNYADHDVRIINDPLDSKGWNMAAWEDNKVVGAVRANPFTDSATDEYRRLYELEGDIEFNLDETVLVTRLMTERHLRGSDLAERLAVASYDWIVKKGYTGVYIDCNDYLTAWFGGLGFNVKRSIQHPEYGSVQVMHLEVRDVDYLEELKSPFLRVLRAHSLVERKRIS